MIRNTEAIIGTMVATASVSLERAVIAATESSE